MALAAFLNVNHQSYPHVAMPAPAFATAVEWTENHRKPLLLKLQNFLLSHPQMTEAGGMFAVVENGELDADTVSALQSMMNCVNLGDDFAADAEVYKSTLCAPSCRWLTACVLISRIFTNSFRRRPPSESDCPRPNLPHGTVLGVAPSGIVGYNCNYDKYSLQPLCLQRRHLFGLQTSCRNRSSRRNLQQQLIDILRRARRRGGVAAGEPFH